jgi:putative transposase
MPIVLNFVKGCISLYTLYSTIEEKDSRLMAKAMTTIKQVLSYQPNHAQWFAENQALYNRVVAFYFEVINAHEKILDLPKKDALTALEKLTHRTEKNPDPIIPLHEIAKDIAAMFRRSAINAALGSARSFFSHLKKWHMQKEKAEARGKKWNKRPPVPPRTWNKSVPFYLGQWKERSDSSIVLKVWSGTCWEWVKVRITGRALPQDQDAGSPALIRQGDRWWLHTPMEKSFKNPSTIEKQVTTNDATRVCAVDLNLGEHIAVCTIQSVEGTILATQFIGGGKEITDFRKKQLGRIARNRSKTGIIAQGEQDNAALWRKIQNKDEQFAHLVSARIVAFARDFEAGVLVFEHLGNLKPTKGKYSHRGNAKRAYWMKGRIFMYSKYKAYHLGMVTTRVNPRNTSRECARCHGLVARYNANREPEGYTMGAPLVFCPNCTMRGNADRNASLVIGQRLVACFQKPKQEKPSTPLRAKRAVKAAGDARSQVSQSEEEPFVPLQSGDGTSIEHGTAQGEALKMDEYSSRYSLPTTDSIE